MVRAYDTRDVCPGVFVGVERTSGAVHDERVVKFPKRANRAVGVRHGSFRRRAVVRAGCAWRIAVGIFVGIFWTRAAISKLSAVVVAWIAGGTAQARCGAGQGAACKWARSAWDNTGSAFVGISWADGALVVGQIQGISGGTDDTVGKKNGTRRGRIPVCAWDALPKSGRFVCICWTRCAYARVRMEICARIACETV